MRAGPAVGCAEASELLAAVEASGREGGREGQAACTCASLAGGGSAGSAGVGAAKACDGAAAAAFEAATAVPDTATAAAVLKQFLL